MEELIRALLTDKLRPPTTHCFLNVYARACGIISNKKIFSFSKFLADLAILVHQNSIFLPSTIAMCSLRFATRRYAKVCCPEEKSCRLLLQRLESMILHSSLQEKEVDLCARELYLNLNKFIHDPLKEALFKKYDKDDIRDLLSYKHLSCDAKQV